MLKCNSNAQFVFLDFCRWKFRKNVLRPYLVFGASCSEVEIDCLTGDHEVNGYYAIKKDKQ